ncbi:MAG: cation:proton antiporter [Phycisphaerales bacterium]|nr:cation:proton antiporter [Phycisphaerales bacterium]MCI0676747.1 cation:proton antiporter [Phycisphaerales bacterium]
MHALTAHEITVVLLSLGVMLALARILGEVFRKFNQPAVIGELLAGIILGPTVLRPVWPELEHWLFPKGGGPEVVLQGITTVAVVLFLLVAGMEVDLSRIFRQGRAAVAVSLSGILVPFGIGLTAAWVTPDFLGRSPEVQPYIFALFFATAMSISALPVIAKTLMDLNLYRSDLGMIVIAAAIFDDLTGWFIFAIVLGLMQHDTGGMLITSTIGLTIFFVAFMLTIGRWLVHWILPWIQAKTSWPGGVLAFALALALFGAAFTESIGIHAVFGSFMVGVALGDSPHLRDRTRATIEQFVSFIFAPLFFASIGLRLNFLAFFDWDITLVVLFIAMVSKVLGCGLGARHAGMGWRESWAIGFGMNSRGAMEIILGTLALEFRVITERLFVALVIMAIATSMISGTAMQWVLQRRAPRRFLDYLHPKGFINPLQAIEREEAIRELARAASGISGLNAEAIEGAVLKRERMMPTGLGLCVAVPHARLHGMNKPLVCLGISRQGIEFAAPDGEPSQMIFLILTPADDNGAQLEILADISRTFLDAHVRQGVMQVNGFTEFIALLRTRQAGTLGGPR